jgi:hypothetical protein
MPFAELDNEQRRQLIDATQAFEAWRAADQEFRHSYQGAMYWRKSKGTEYLGRKYGNVWQQSLGPRSPETERIKADYTEARARLRQRRTRLTQRLDRMAPVNRALRLGRMPPTPARILRKLDEAGLLGRQLIVVGTNSLYAYEARSGVLLDAALTATTDIDLLIDVRLLSLAMVDDVRPEGVMGLLRRADKSFERVADYRAVNDEGYYVDLIAPLRPDEVTAPVIRLGETNDDLAAAAIVGLQWLINAPKFETVVVADDGRPLWMACIDPRAFALHKL